MQCSKLSRHPNGNHASVPLTPPPPPPPSGYTDIGRSPSSLDTSEHGHMPWRKSHKAVSSIFKPRRTRSGSDAQRHENRKMIQHPSHLHVPVLTSSGTASFAEAWGSNDHHGQSSSPRHQQHCQTQNPPPTRSPKTIRFRDDDPSLHQSDVAVEITPNPEVSPTTSRRKHYGGFVSRRGRRPGLISRHSTH